MCSKGRNVPKFMIYYRMKARYRMKAQRKTTVGTLVTVTVLGLTVHDVQDPFCKPFS